VHADNKVEAGEMDVEGRTTRPLDQNNHFLPVQPNQRAYSWVGFPCVLQGKGLGRTWDQQSMKDPPTGVSGCDGNGLTGRESKSPRLLGIKSGMILHISLLDQLQSLFTRQLLHWGDV